jgi:hypothetical protein
MEASCIGTSLLLLAIELYSLDDDTLLGLHISLSFFIFESKGGYVRSWDMI